MDRRWRSTPNRQFLKNVETPQDKTENKGVTPHLLQMQQQKEKKQPKCLPYKIPENQFVNLLNWLEKLSYTQLQRLEFEVKELLEELEELRAENPKITHIHQGGPIF